MTHGKTASNSSIYQAACLAAKNSKAKSLTQLIKSDKYSDISYGIKFCAGNIGLENNIYTFPYYCTFLLKRYLKDMQ